MNCILISPEELDPAGRVILHDRRLDHIVKVIKAGPGDILRMGIINSDLGQGRIEELDSHRVVLFFTPLSPPPARPLIDLIIALPRPIMLKRILAQAASLGVGRIFLINSNRVEKSFFQASLLKNENYRSYLIDGLEQAVDTRLPGVSIHPRFRPFVEDFLPGLLSGYSHCLLAHPQGPTTLAGLVRPLDSGRVLLALGPEGGWVNFEVSRFRGCGFKPFTLGPRILRLETAVVALIAQLTLLREMDGSTLPARRPWLSHRAKM
ncbi:MAG: 16S rRNA (uracil(1498)-N(3))-methyltransferase [Desulfobacterales bacterium]|nr:16S rRNA (uracil(1498)-N(3))-methyltransferase [Desulfobacterales bacterium]